MSPEPALETGPSSPDASSRRDRDADGVAGHDHRHRRERRLALARAISAAQRLRGGAAVGSGDDAEGHGGIVRPA